MTIERLGVVKVKVNITRMAWEMEMDSKSLRPNVWRHFSLRRVDGMQHVMRSN